MTHTEEIIKEVKTELFNFLFGVSRNKTEIEWFVDEVLAPKLEAMEKEIREEEIQKLNMKYSQAAFLNDMGDHVVAWPGVQESTHIRRATTEEAEVINTVYYLLSQQKEEYRYGNCPFCDSERGYFSAWGMSPNGWEQVKKEHKKHNYEK